MKSLESYLVDGLNELVKDRPDQSVSKLYNLSYIEAISNRKLKGVLYRCMHKYIEQLLGIRLILDLGSVSINFYYKKCLVLQLRKGETLPDTLSVISYNIEYKMSDLVKSINSLESMTRVYNRLYKVGKIHWYYSLIQSKNQKQAVKTVNKLLEFTPSTLECINTYMMWSFNFIDYVKFVKYNGILYACLDTLSSIFVNTVSSSVVKDQNIIECLRSKIQLI